MRRILPPLLRSMGVIAAMAAEARALRPLRQTTGGLHLRDDGTLVSISGIGADAATSAAQSLASGGATALMSFGLAGGLDPALRPGSIVLPDQVMRRDGPAFATAQALTGGQINLVTIVIGAQLRGDVLGDAGLGYALALGMVVVMAVAITGYTLLQRRSERWLR